MSLLFICLTSSVGRKKEKMITFLFCLAKKEIEEERKTETCECSLVTYREKGKKKRCVRQYLFSFSFT